MNGGEGGADMRGCCRCICCTAACCRMAISSLRWSAELLLFSSRKDCMVPGTFPRSCWWRTELISDRVPGRRLSPGSPSCVAPRRHWLALAPPTATEEDLAVFLRGSRRSALCPDNIICFISGWFIERFIAAAVADAAICLTMLICEPKSSEELALFSILTPTCTFLLALLYTFDRRFGWELRCTGSKILWVDIASCHFL